MRPLFTFLLLIGVCRAQPEAPRLEDPPLAASGESFFQAAGDAVEEAQERLGPHWRRHLDASKQAIEAAAALVSEPGQAIVLGAGECREIPLEALARRFDSILLVDLDAPSMRRAVALLPAELQPKVEIREQDVTSFASALIERIAVAVAEAETADEALDAVGKLLGGAEAGTPPALPAADLVVSSLVLSELHRYPLTFADRALRERFGVRLGDSPGYPRWREGLRRLALQDHSRLLAGLARPGGVVYWADTTARGPLRERLTQTRRDRALGFADRALAALRSSRGEDPAFQRELERVHSAVHLDSAHSAEDAGGAPPPVRRYRLADTTLRLVCAGWFEPEHEAETLEIWLAGLPAAEAFEELVDVSEVIERMAEKGLEPERRRHWFWIQYPCSVVSGGGAFNVEAVVFRAAGP